MPPKPSKPAGSCGTEKDDEGRVYNPHDGNWETDAD